MVRRAQPGRAGHTLIYHVYAGDWQPAGECQLELTGSTIDELWASLCSQAILGTPDFENLDARIVQHGEIERLEADVDKLTRDHQRAKNPAQRKRNLRQTPQGKDAISADARSIRRYS